MRLVAHIMVFLLAAVALFHGAVVKMEIGRQEALALHQQKEKSGSIVIYKTPATPGFPVLRQVRGHHARLSLPECPIGYCQDI